MRKSTPKPLSTRISPSSSKSIALAALVALALLPAVTRAQTDTWLGTTNNLWDVGTNWSTGAEPTALNDALFPTPIPTLTIGGGIILTPGEVANSLTFRANYTLAEGDLTLSAAGTIASGFITVATGSTATIASQLIGGATITIAGNNLLAGGDVQAGGGTIDFLGNNTYSGGTVLNSGVLGVGSATALGTGGVTIAAGTITAVNGNNVLSNAVTVNGNFTIGRSTTSDGLDLTNTVALGNAIRTITVNNFQQRISGVISGSTLGGLLKTGGGDLFLSGANTYVNDTTVNNGSLRLTGAGTTGADVVGNDVFVIPTAANASPILRLEGPANFGANQILSLNFAQAAPSTPAGRADAAAILGLGSGFAQGTGNTVNFSGAGSGLQNIRLASNANFAAIVLDGIAYADDVIAKTNAAAAAAPVWLGATTLNGAYTGATLSAGLGSTYRLGGGGGTLSITNANVLTGAASLIVGSPDATGRGLPVTAFIPQAQTFAGATAATAITVGSGGTLIAGQNASLGDAANDIVLAAGTLNLRSTGVHGATDAQYIARDLNVIANSTLNVDPLGGGQNVTLQIGNVTFTGGARSLVVNASNSFDFEVTGTTTFASTAAAAFNDTISNTGLATFSGPIVQTGTGLASLFKDNTGNLILENDNSYGGTTILRRGTLTLANTGAAGTANSGITMDPIAAQTALLDLRSDASGTSAAPVVFDFNTLTLGGLATTAARTINVDRVSGSGSAAVLSFLQLRTALAGVASPDILVTGERGYTLQISGSGAATPALSLDSATGTSFAFNVRGTRVELGNGTAGSVAIADGAATSVNLVKGDSGVLIISGSSDYGGTTQVNQGTLVVNHDTAGTADVFGAGAVSFNGVSATALNNSAGILISGARTVTSAITNSSVSGFQVLGGLNDAGTKTFSGNITLSTPATAPATTRGILVAATPEGDVALTGTISETVAGQSVFINVSGSNPLVTANSAGTITTQTGILPGNAGTPAFGRGTVILNPISGTGNTFTGGLVANNGTVIGQAQLTSGSPFGNNAPITINEATVRLNGLAGAAASTTVTTGALTIGGGANLVISDLAAGGNTTFTVGSIVRAASGIGTLAIIPFSGSAEEVFTVTGAAPTANGILAPWIVRAASDTNRAADFVSKPATTVVVATYTSSDVDAAGNTNASIVQDLDGGTLTGNRAAFALKLNSSVNAGGFTLNLGDQSAVGTLGGLILNAGAGISNGTINVGASELALYVDDAASSTISANIASTQLFTTTLTSLTKFGAGTLILSGNNTYRGATTINRGTLQAGVANSLGGPFTNAGAVGATALTVGGQGTFNLAGFNTEVGSLAGDFGAVVNLGSATLTLGRNNLATTFSGQIIGGAGSIVDKVGTNRTILDNTRLATGAGNNFGTLRINQGVLQVIVTGVSSGTPYPTNSSLPPVTEIILRGGELELYSTGDNTGSQQTFFAGNNLTVTGAPSIVETNRFNAGDSNKLIELGSLTLGRASISFVGGNNVFPKFLGPVTLTDNAVISPGGVDVMLDGVISDGGAGYTLNKGSFSTLHINAVNTYSGGTVVTGGGLFFGSRGTDPIRFPGLTQVPNAFARAGTGDIIVQSAATITFNDTTNVGAGQETRLISGPFFNTTLAVVRTDRPVQDYNIRSIERFGLALAMGNGTWTQPLNLSRLGDGTGGLSAALETVYTPTTLGVGAGNTYRFYGSSSGALILQERNLLTGTAMVELGRTIIDSGGIFIANANISLRLVTDQNYTGNTLIHRSPSTFAAGPSIPIGQTNTTLDFRGSLASPVIENYGRLIAFGAGRFTNDAGIQVNNVQIRPGSFINFDYQTAGATLLAPTGSGVGGSSPLAFTTNKWQDDLALNLDGATLAITNTNVAQTVEKIGALNYSGGAEIQTIRVGTNGQPFLVINGALNRTDLATLAFRPNVAAELGTVATAVGGSNVQRVVVSNPANRPARLVVGATTVNMVAPRFFDYTSQGFLDYDPTPNIGLDLGFRPVPYVQRNSATFNTGGLNNGTEVIQELTTAVTIVPTGADVLALRTDVAISDGATPDTITIRSGGLASVSSAAATILVDVPLSFSNGGVPQEADIWTTLTGSTNGLILNRTITANNLTKNGQGRLILAGANTGTLTGNIQVNGGALEVRNPASLGDVTNIRLHSAYLNQSNVTGVSAQVPRIDFRLDTTSAATGLTTGNFRTRNVTVSQFVQQADLAVGSFAGAITNPIVVIGNLTIEGGGSDGTQVNLFNVNTDTDLTVAGTTTLGLPGNASRIGLNAITASGTFQTILAGQVTGPATLVKNGGTGAPVRLQNLAGGATGAPAANNYSGGTVINDGILELQNSILVAATGASGSTTLTAPTGQPVTPNLIGTVVTGTGIAANTTITAIDAAANTVTLSTATTAAVTSVILNGSLNGTLAGTGPIEINRGFLRTISELNNSNLASAPGNSLSLNGHTVLEFNRASAVTALTEFLGGDSSTLSTRNSGIFQYNSAANIVTGVWAGNTLINDNPYFNIQQQNFQLGNLTGGDVLAGVGHLVKTGGYILTLNNGAASTLSGGIDITQGQIRAITNTDTFGTGPIRISPDAVIGVQSTANLSGGSSQIVNLHSNSTAPAGISLRANGLVPTDFVSPSAVTTATGNGGLLAIDATYTTAINLATLYDGYWFVGSTTGGTLNNTTANFGVGAEDTYRLGGGDSTLNLSATTTSNQLVGTAKVLIGRPNSLYGAGTVLIRANNTYSGGTTLSRTRDRIGNFNVATADIQQGFTNAPLGTGSVEVYGNLIYQGAGGSAVFSDAANSNPNRNTFNLHPGSRLIFENTTPYVVPTGNTEGRFDDATAIVLNNTSLELVGDDSTSLQNTETIGAVTYMNGNSEIRSARRLGFGSELRIDGALTRQGTATLTLNHDAGFLGINGNATNVSAGSGVNRIIVTDPNFATANTAQNMVNPYIISRAENQFLKYDAALGFQLITQGGAPTNYVATTAATLDGTNPLLTNGTGIVSYDGTAATTLGANLDVHAFRLQGDVNSSANGQFNQITIRSGGLVHYGAAGRTITANLVFGTTVAPAEALIYASAQALNINGQITASTITKFGASTVQINQDQPNFTGAWNVNQGLLTIATPGGLGNGSNLVNLTGWTGNTGQTTTQLSLQFNSGTPDEVFFASGKITSTDLNLITANTANDRTFRIADLDLRTTTGAAGLTIPGVIRLQVNNSRSTLRTGTVTLFDNYQAYVDAGSFGPGTGVTVAFGGLNNQGLYDFTKVGDAVLSLGDISGTFTGVGRTITVNEGALRATSATGSLGGVGTTTIIDNGGALEIAVAGFAPVATLVERSGAIERWAVDGARTGIVNLGSGVNLQIAATQTGATPTTINLNGGSIMGYEAIDVEATALILELRQNVSINLLADSSIGQPFPAGTHVVTGTASHIFYDMGKQNRLNNPLDPQLFGAYLQILGNITGTAGGDLLTKVGEDTILVGGNNSGFDTNVRQGVLQMGSATALGIDRSVAVQADGVLDINGFDSNFIRIGGDAPQSRIVNSKVGNAGDALNTLTVGRNSVADSYNGTIQGGIQLVKQGSSSYSLAGANTYTGTTTVSSGALLANNTTGSATGLGDVSVSAGGTLGGPGSVGGNVIINTGGTLAPGNSPGTLDIGGSLALNQNSTFSVELGGTQPGDGPSFYDQVNVAKNITLNSPVQLTLALVNSFVPGSGDQFFVLTQTGVTPFAGLFNGAADNSTIDFGNGISAQITYDANWTGLQGTSSLDGGNDVALFNVIPEPGSLVSLLGGMATLLGLQRFRRRRS